MKMVNMSKARGGEAFENTVPEARIIFRKSNGQKIMRS
jgi:hypothetical protein